MGKLGCWARKTLSLFAGCRVIVERALCLKKRGAMHVLTAQPKRVGFLPLEFPG